MRKYTYEDVASLNPCWLRDDREAELRERLRGGKTALQIARASDVSVENRRWVLVRLASRQARGRQLLVTWAAACAQDVRGRLSGDAQDAADVAIQVAVAWADGVGTEQDGRDATAAAYAAAYAAYAASAADADAHAHADAASAAAYAASATDAASYAASYAAVAAASAAAAAGASAAAEQQLLELARMMATW
jgi:hypothetical protein